MPVLEREPYGLETSTFDPRSHRHQYRERSHPGITHHNTWYMVTQLHSPHDTSTHNNNDVNITNTAKYRTDETNNSYNKTPWINPSDNSANATSIGNAQVDDLTPCQIKRWESFRSSSSARRNGGRQAPPYDWKHLATSQSGPKRWKCPYLTSNNRYHRKIRLEGPIGPSQTSGRSYEYFLSKDAAHTRGILKKIDAPIRHRPAREREIMLGYASDT